MGDDTRATDETAVVLEIRCEVCDGTGYRRDRSCYLDGLCHDCHGTGYQLTDFGVDVWDFLHRIERRRYYLAQKRDIEEASSS